MVRGIPTGQTAYTTSANRTTRRIVLLRTKSRDKRNRSANARGEFSVIRGHLQIADNSPRVTVPRATVDRVTAVRRKTNRRARTRHRGSARLLVSRSVKRFKPIARSTRTKRDCDQSSFVLCKYCRGKKKKTYGHVTRRVRRRGVAPILFPVEPVHHSHHRAQFRFDLSRRDVRIDRGDHF